MKIMHVTAAMLLVAATACGGSDRSASTPSQTTTTNGSLPDNTTSTAFPNAPTPAPTATSPELMPSQPPANNPATVVPGASAPAGQVGSTPPGTSGANPTSAWSGAANATVNRSSPLPPDPTTPSSGTTGR